MRARRWIGRAMVFIAVATGRLTFTGPAAGQGESTIDPQLLEGNRLVLRAANFSIAGWAWTPMAVPPSPVLVGAFATTAPSGQGLEVIGLKNHAPLDNHAMAGFGDGLATGVATAGGERVGYTYEPAALPWPGSYRFHLILRVRERQEIHGFGYVAETGGAVAIVEAFTTDDHEPAELAPFAQGLQKAAAKPAAVLPRASTGLRLIGLGGIDAGWLGEVGTSLLYWFALLLGAGLAGVTMPSRNPWAAGMGVVLLLLVVKTVLVFQHGQHGGLSDRQISGDMGGQTGMALVPLIAGVLLARGRRRKQDEAARHAAFQASLRAKRNLPSMYPGPEPSDPAGRYPHPPR